MFFDSSLGLVKFGHKPQMQNMISGESLCMIKLYLVCAASV